MARHPGRCLLLLLLLTCCPAAAQVDLLSLNWLWSTRTARPTAEPVSEAPGSPHVQPRDETGTPVTPQPGPTEQSNAPASPEPPLRGLETDEHVASAAPSAPPTGPNPKEEKEENIAGVGAKILNVAQGIRSFVQLWDDTTRPESSSTAGPPAPVTPTRPLALPGPSRPPPENGTALWLGSTDAPRTEASTLPAPTQLPPSLDRPRAALREPSGPPPSPGRASLSSAPRGAPPGGSQPSPGPPQDLDGEGLWPGQQHRLPGLRGRSPQLLPLVMGALGADAAPSALSSDPPALLPGTPLSAVTGGRGAWAAPAVDSLGPGPANNSAPLPPAAGRCLPLPPALPVCGRLGIGRAWLPNHLQHGSRDEVRAAARAWGGLLRTRCHRFLARFVCLLLAPPCRSGPPPAPPPCRQFCEALEDACWSHLPGAGLPVPCASLPAQEDGLCVFIGPGAGNPRPSASCRAPGNRC
ncbi:Collagen alpha-1(XVIII) chain [Vulpes lagopus]